jgi:multidrug efflux system outer membrane protein
MNMHKFQSLVAAASLLLIALLGGCAMGPDYQRPVLDLPTTYRDEPVLPGRDIPDNWWTLYNDSTLNSLVEEVLKTNSDARIAAAQVEEAQAVLRQVDAALWPEIDVGGGASRSRVSTDTALPNVAPLVRDERRVSASTSFELDFWGKLRRASEAARAQALSTAYGREVVRLTLAGTTTQGYLSLRSLDAQVAAVRSSLATREEALEVVRNRRTAGLASDLDYNQALGARADAASQLTELQRQRLVAENLLAALTGRAELRIAAGDLRSLPLPPLPPPGLPSALLERRPDVRAAEQNLIAANAQIGVAKAALFPSISLTGSYGGQSAALSTLLDSGARIWTGGFGLTLPIFDAGRNFARVDQNIARQQQSLFAYQKVIAAAFREVADAIVNTQQSAKAEADLQARLDAARNSLELAQARYQAGYSAYLEVLDAQRTANDAELALIRNRQSQLGYSVDFMKSLGGGWNRPVAAN